MQAVKSTNITFVNQLLNISDVDVNMEDVWCHTALVWAVYKADMDTILLLMKQDGINVDKALIVAAFYGYEDLITLFLSEVKDVNVNATDRHGNTALLCAIQNNTEGTDKEIIVDLLLKNPNLNVNVINKYGDSTLIQAVRARNYHLVESLLFHPSCDTNGLGFIEHRDIHGVDAFTWALHCNCLDIASLIAEHHMELATVSQQRSPADFLGASYCKTALTSSIVSLLRRQYDELRAKNDSEAVQVSPQSAQETSPTQNVNMTGVDTWDFLFCDTIFNKHIVSHLLTREDLQVNKFDQNGCSALTWSMTHQNERLVRILLDRPDVLVNKADTAGFTPLMLACRDGYVKFAELIARREDIFVNIRGGPDGKTAIQLAIDNEHMEIGARLAKRNDIELEVVFRNAIESSNDTIVRLLLDNMPAGIKRKDNLIDIMLELAVRWPQDVVATDSRINSRYDSADSIVQLLSKECSVKEKNDTRATAVKNDDSRCDVHVYMSPSKIISWFCVLVLLAGFIMYHYGYSTFDEYMKL
jgi:ankyrin repeat protein